MARVHHAGRAQRQRIPAMSPARLSRSPVAWLLAASALLLTLGILLWEARARETGEEVTSLLSTGKTVLGQSLAYPTGARAKVTAAIVSMQPGAETGWHRHDVPLFGYMLEGELTVDYGPKGTRVYRRGDALMEAIDVPHNGRNTGSGVARILAVFMGADGVPDTVMVAAPKSPQ
jgi:quercetin dioxygenase-like cupin family protein